MVLFWKYINKWGCYYMNITINTKHLYQWLLNQKPKPLGMEIIYDTKKHEVVELGFYKEPDGIIMKHPISLMSTNKDRNNYKLANCGITILEPNREGVVSEITHRYYYEESGVWCCGDTPFTGPTLESNIKILHLFYDYKELLERYCKLNKC